MIDLRSTWPDASPSPSAPPLILLFLALPIVVILVTSFGKDAFGSFPPDGAGRSTGTRQLFADGSKWPAALS